MKDINSLNKVILIGHVGNNPDVRLLPNQNILIAKFPLATSEYTGTSPTGERTKRTEWHRIVCWGALAKFVDDYIRKGKQVLVEGKIRYNTWTDQNNITRKTAEIYATQIVLLGKKSPDGGEEVEDFEDTSDFPPSVDDSTADDDLPF